MHRTVALGRYGSACVCGAWLMARGGAFRLLLLLLSPFVPGSDRGVRGSDLR